jgi:hypothetical protein
MKRSFLALAALVVIATSAAARAEPYLRERGYDSGPNLLLVDPGALLNGVLSVEYERALASWFGLSVGLSVWTFHGLFSPSGDPSYVSVGPELGAKFHVIGDAPGGLWLGPTLAVGYLAARSSGTLSRPWSWGLGAAIGYNFIFGHHFTFQLGAGGQFTDYGDFVAWSPRLLLGLGSAF